VTGHTPYTIVPVRNEKHVDRSGTHTRGRPPPPDICPRRRGSSSSSPDSHDSYVRYTRGHDRNIDLPVLIVRALKTSYNFSFRYFCFLFILFTYNSPSRMFVCALYRAYGLLSFYRAAPVSGETRVRRTGNDELNAAERRGQNTYTYIYIYIYTKRNIGFNGAKKQWTIFHGIDDTHVYYCARACAYVFYTFTFQM